jgi:hypothetical protein
MNMRMREIGLEAYFEETKDLCRYLWSMSHRAKEIQKYKELDIYFKDATISTSRPLKVMPV